MLGYWVWNVSKEMFALPLPFLGRPVLWYGFFFALGFFLGYLLIVYLLKRYFFQGPLQAVKIIAEKALLYASCGVVIGARLADVLFYQDLQDLITDPLLVIRVWEGGLSSHGGALGAVVALAIFFQKNRSSFKGLSFLGFLDFVCLPAAVISASIRIGNFFNQEILGTKTNLPWGVYFMNPADRSIPAVRHPVQLYEAFFYLLIAALLWKSRKILGKAHQGKILGFFLMSMFGFRIGVEYFKMEQSVQIATGSFFTMGQYLSIPLFLLGIGLVFKTSSLRRLSPHK